MGGVGPRPAQWCRVVRKTLALAFFFKKIPRLKHHFCFRIHETTGHKKIRDKEGSMILCQMSTQLTARGTPPFAISPLLSGWFLPRGGGEGDRHEVTVPPP